MEGREKVGGNNVSVSSKGGDESDVVRELMGVIETVGSYAAYRKTQRKECLSLVRRLKLLVPLLEEILELGTPVSGEALNCLADLRKALLAAKKLLRHCSYGSKIYLVSVCSISLYPFLLVLRFSLFFIFPIYLLTLAALNCRHWKVRQ
jgi:hypothetical protein